MAIEYWLADAIRSGGCRLNIHYVSDWISLIGIEYSLGVGLDQPGGCQCSLTVGLVQPD
jgi:hypothetical protein